MIRFTCPQCRKAFQVQDELGGRNATCRSCGAAIAIPPAEATDAPSRGLPSPAIAAPSATLPPKKPFDNVYVDANGEPRAASQATKQCAFCGETILDVARKCKHCGSMLTEAPAEQEQPEQILADVGANMFRGMESVGGRMKITTRRVLFEAHAFNLQKMPAQIPITDIAEVGKRNTLGIVPNGLFIRTKGGVEYKFVVFGRDKLIGIIQAQLDKRAP